MDCVNELSKWVGILSSKRMAKAFQARPQLAQMVLCCDSVRSNGEQRERHVIELDTFYMPITV